MAITNRRTREKTRRREQIMAAAWCVAEKKGWSGFSMEAVAFEAELGRATLYSYFEALDVLVSELATEALKGLEDGLAKTEDLTQALDVPVRLALEHSARFELLYPTTCDPRPHMNSPALRQVRERARTVLGRLERVARNQAGVLPEDSRERVVFVSAVCMACATTPELRNSTTLRHRFHELFLAGSACDPDCSKNR